MAHLKVVILEILGRHDIMSSMEFVAGFVVGYFLKKFFEWLDTVAQPHIPDDYKEEDWDWIS